MPQILRLIRSKITPLSKIDIIIIFIIFVLAGFFAFRFSRHSEFIYIDLTSETQDWQTQPILPSYWKTSAIRVDDLIYSSTGSKVGKVLDVQKVYVNSDKQSIHLTIQLNVIKDISTQTFTFNGQPLLIGQTFGTVLGKTSFSGTITNIYEHPDDKNKVQQSANAVIKVKYRNLEPWHAESLKEFTVTDSEGKKMIETLNTEIEPAEMITTNSTGDVFKKHSPIGKDVTLTLKLYGLQCASGTCYYLNSIPLKIGSPFNASSDKTILSPNQDSSFLPTKSSIMEINIEQQ